MEEYKEKMDGFILELKNKTKIMLGRNFSNVEQTDKEMLDQNYKRAMNEISGILDNYRYEDKYFQKAEEILNESKYEIGKFIGKSRDRKNEIQNKSKDKIYDENGLEKDENKTEEDLKPEKAIDKFNVGFERFQNDNEFVDKEIQSKFFRSVDDNLMTITKDKFRRLLTNYDDINDEKGLNALADITKALEYKLMDEIKDGFQDNTKKLNKDLIVKIEEVLQEELPKKIEEIKQEVKREEIENKENDSSGKKLSFRDELKSNVVKDEEINLNALAFEDNKFDRAKKQQQIDESKAKEESMKKLSDMFI